tara:strand:- start:947 stop:2182 length:1236 start_codon:yes stop_codon:yes gene_type:complete
MEFRDYQKDIIIRGHNILFTYGMLYLSMEVRTGKTLTALGICEKHRVDKILFITKKKAIPSIKADYKLLSPPFKMDIINYESLHKITSRNYDIIICDEAHSISAFPKPSKRAKLVRDKLLLSSAKLILMSGTPTPESFSQMYHQVYGYPYNPFKHYKNFYAWCKDYVNVKEKYINSMPMKDYSDGIESKIFEAMDKYMISYTQQQAGFEAIIDEEILEVDMSPMTYQICKSLQRDLVVEGNNDTILADTPVKLMQKLHQLYSGTVILESGKALVIDDTKAKFIRDNFIFNKIAIFYKFKAELKALKEVYGDKLTEVVEDFDNEDYTAIALQIVSGREGISLKAADYLVYYNIDFSATSYWQSRDRMTTKTRQNNKIYWIFSKGGMEYQVYNAVNKKKNYTLNHFKRDANAI